MKRSVTAVMSATAAGAVLIVSLLSVGVASAAPDRPRGDRPIPQLVSSGTISREQAREVRDALVAARPAKADSAREQGISGLVSAGTLTQAQADAVLAVEKPHGLLTLIADGTLTVPQLIAIRDAVKGLRADTQADRTDARAAALAELVSDSTITQAQAGAIESAIAAAKAAHTRAA